MNADAAATATTATAAEGRAMPELHLLLADREGALVRLLGLVERRGFRLGAVKSSATPRGMRLSLTLASDDRAADVLLRQVARLQDVLDAALDVRPRPVSQAAP